MNDTPIDDLATWLVAYQQATLNAKQWNDTAERAKQHIIAHLEKADADVGTINGEPAVRWTVVESHRLDVKKLRSEYPDLASAFTRPSVTRRFTVVDGA
jgi:predicted phage-related endonuclease